MGAEQLSTILNESLIADDGEMAASLTVAFKAVAARHRGRALDVEPVGVELVERALEISLGIRASNSANHRAMVRTIAQTLLEDEAARGRLDQLWRRFSSEHEAEGEG